MHQRRSVRAQTALLGLSLALAAACSSGGGGGGGSSAATLDSIDIEPHLIQVPWGFTQQLTARGHYSDNTTQDLTFDVQWTSSAPSVAVVNDGGASKGMLSAIATGDAVITATLGELTTQRIAHVVDPVLSQVVVTPSSVQMAVGAEEPFACTAFFVGGWTRDVTRNAKWFTSDASVATVGDTGDAKGIVTAVGFGQCQIRARYKGFEDVSDVVAIEVDVLDPDVAPQKEPTAPRCATDAAGTIVAAWAYEGAQPGRILWRRYAPGSGWSGKQDVAPITDETFAPVIAGNEAGVRFVAWSSRSALWVARYDDVAGWGTPVQIDSGSLADQFTLDVAAGVFANGDALIVWRSSEDDQLRGKVYVEGSGWGSTATIGGVGSSQHPIALASNPAGEAQLLWQHFDAGVWSLNASRFTVAGGFEAPVLLYSSAIYHQPAAAIDSVGNALAVWIDFTPFPDAHLYAARFVAGAWETPELVSDLDVPREPKVALDDAGNAFAIWRHAMPVGTGLSGSRYVPGTGWEERELIQDSPSGIPAPFPPHLDGLGGVTAYWTAGTAADGDRLEVARYVPGTGWSEAESFDFMGAEGAVLESQLDVHASGAAIVTWSEGQAAGDVLFAHRFE